MQTLGSGLRLRLSLDCPEIGSARLRVLSLQHKGFKLRDLLLLLLLLLDETLRCLCRLRCRLLPKQVPGAQSLELTAVEAGGRGCFLLWLVALSDVHNCALIVESVRRMTRQHLPTLPGNAIP